MLKALGDDTRLRIIKLLQQQPLSVTELGQVLDVSQPNLSKHLAKLRLTGIVGDRRDGMNVFYYLSSPKDKAEQKLVQLIAFSLEGSQKCQSDSEKLEALKSSEVA